MTGIAESDDARPSPGYTVVVPTVRRPALPRLLASVDAAAGPAPARIIVVDDSPEPPPPAADPAAALGLAKRPSGAAPLRLARSGGRGPAAARNIGWRLARTGWVVFLDDDVEVTGDWARALVADLVEADRVEAAASQAVLEVPAPPGAGPTDGHRATLGLADARWITADMAYRRDALVRLGGFDEGFPRAYREDADLGLRAHRAFGVLRGGRRTVHPLREESFFASVRAQRGNADDALMRREHGAQWRTLIGEGPGRLRRHLAIVAAGTLAVAAAAAARPRPAAPAAGLWALGTGELLRARLRGGPGGSAETVRMAVTSVAIPPAAVLWRLRGELGVRTGAAARRRDAVRAVLFDRDDTLIVDVPYLADPARVRPTAQARAAVDRVRAAGLRIGVVSNQSGIARGLLTEADVAAVDDRVSELLGPMDTWQTCPHGPDDGCRCRKPAPGMVQAAAAALGLQPRHCLVIGDIGADVEAARAAGARAMLVPTERTLRAEVDDARRRGILAADLAEALARGTAADGPAGAWARWRTRRAVRHGAGA